MIGIDRMIKLILKGTYGNQQVRNIFWYVLQDVVTDYNSSGGIDLLKSIAEAFDVDVWKGAVNDGVVAGFGNVSFEAIAPDPNSATYWEPGIRVEVLSDEGGQSVGDGAPSFDAYGLRKRPISPSLVRIGQVRFCGVNEGNSDFGVLNGGGTTRVMEMAAALEAPLNVVDPTLTSPNAFLMIPKTQNFGTAVKPDYREIGAYRVETVEPHPFIRSQVSRQRGRGR